MKLISVHEKQAINTTKINSSKLTLKKKKCTTNDSSTRILDVANTVQGGTLQKKDIGGTLQNCKITPKLQE